MKEFRLPLLPILLFMSGPFLIRGQGVMPGPKGQGMSEDNPRASDGRGPSSGDPSSPGQYKDQQTSSNDLSSQGYPGPGTTENNNNPNQVSRAQGQGQGQDSQRRSGSGFPSSSSSDSGGILIHKHVWVHVAPTEILEPSTPRPNQRMMAQGRRREKHYKILFIKAPEPQVPDLSQSLALQPPDMEQKTLVYVLLKKPDSNPMTQLLPTQPPTKPSKPEVYFIRYKSQVQPQQTQQSQEQSQQAYGSPERPSPQESSNNFQDGPDQQQQPDGMQMGQGQDGSQSQFSNYPGPLPLTQSQSSVPSGLYGAPPLPPAELRSSPLPSPPSNVP